eukprot:2585715-Prymnesium_polylepis.1
MKLERGFFPAAPGPAAQDANVPHRGRGVSSRNASSRAHSPHNHTQARLSVPHRGIMLSPVPMPVPRVERTSESHKTQHAIHRALHAGFPSRIPFAWCVCTMQREAD